MTTIKLTGQSMSLQDVRRIADGGRVALGEAGLARMAASRQLIDAAVRAKKPVYGVTTGLGPRVVEALDEAEIATFALSAVRGRAHAAGEDLPEAACRAALGVRINTLLIGASGARPEMARHMAVCLNAGLAPAIRGVGSIGAADLMWGGDFGLALIGEGRMWAQGEIVAASDALAGAGLAAFAPGPREGLALVSHSSPSAALAALGVGALASLYEAMDKAAALTLEGFRANLGAFDPALLALRPQPGQDEAAARIMSLMAGSPLQAPGAARRLQDPLSIRNIPQVHGAYLAALNHARAAVEAEINGASDNPGVLVERGEIASHGGYLTPHLVITLGALSQATAQIAAVQAARIGRMLSGRFTELPNGLTRSGAIGAGLGPVMKTVEALFAEIAHAAAPPPIYPSFSADGLEDVACHTAIAAKAMGRIAGHWRRLIAIEMIVAAQAIELRGVEVAPALMSVLEELRSVSHPTGEDRPLGGEIEALAANLPHPTQGP